MAYPPSDPAANKANATPAVTDHPNHHNELATAIATIVDELGAGPKGGAADLTARLAALASTDISDFNTAAVAAGSGTYVALTSGSTVATIQAAVDAVSAAGGGEVHLAKGTYTGTLTAHPSGHSANAVLWLPSNVKLTGAGIGQTVIKVADSATAVGTPAVYAVVMTTSVDSGSTSDITVSDLTIDGNAGNQTILMHGLRFTRCQQVRVDRVEVRNVLGGLASNSATERFHLEAHRSADVTVTDCIVQATSQTWDTSSGFSANYSTNVSWLGCLVRNMKLGMGFTIFASSACSFANCRAYGCQNTSGSVNARGFNCEASEDVHYVNCTSGGRAAEDASNPFFTSQQTLPNTIGFTCSGGRRVDYVGCNSSYNSLDGLWFTANTNFVPDRTTENARIVGGQFSDNGRYGINLDSLAGVTLSPATVVRDNTTADVNGLQFAYDFGRSDLASDPIIRMRAAAGQNRDIQLQTGTLSRWIIRATNDAESGSDAGSNLQIISRTDAGGFKATVVSIDRQSGDITLGNGVDLAVGTSTGTKIGTSAAQKLGFFNATPVVQPSAVSSKAALESLGLGASITDGQDVEGLGIVTNYHPPAMSAYGNAGMSANQCRYSRLKGAGVAITSLRYRVGTSSGNISVALYTNSGSGRSALPSARQVTSGAVACPASGNADIAISSTTPVAGWWSALSCDNGTAQFSRSFAVGSGWGEGYGATQGSAHPAPSPAAASADNSVYAVVGL